jgi:hypothetical protein
MEAFPYIAKRFAMTRFLGLTEEEIEENQRMWFEEREAPEDNDAKGSDLRSIGISTGDLETDAEAMDEIPDPNAEGMPADPMAGGPPVAPPAGMAGATAPAPPM